MAYPNYPALASTTTLPQLTTRLLRSPGFTVFNVREFGALGDGLTDDTAAIRAAIAACVAAGGGIVYFPNGDYIIVGTRDATTNGILTFPVNLSRDEAPIVRIIGQSKGRKSFASAGVSAGGVILNASSAAAGSGTDPSVIALAQSLTPAAEDFNCVEAHFDNLDILLPSNPSLFGINARNALRLTLGHNVGIYSKCINSGGIDVYQEPTHGTTGVLMPRWSNDVIQYCGRSVIAGFDTALEAGEHTHMDGTYLIHSLTGLLIPEGAHAITGGASIEICATSLRCAGSPAKDPVVKLTLNIEEKGGTEWNSAVRTIDDPNNHLFGKVDVNIIEAGTGNFRPVTKRGARYLHIENLRDPNRELGIYGATEIAKWKMDDLSDSTGSFTLTDHGTVTYSAGGKIGNKANYNGTNQWHTSALNVAGGNFSASGWFKVTAGKAAQVLIAQYAAYPDSRWIVVYLDASKTVQFVVAQDAGEGMVESDPIDTAVDHHLVVQYHHALKVIRMQLDNGPWVTLTMAAAMATIGSTPALSLGAGTEGSGGSGSGHLQGWLDSWRVHSELIDKERATELFAGGRGTEK